MAMMAITTSNSIKVKAAAPPESCRYQPSGTFVLFTFALPGSELATHTDFLNPSAARKRPTLGGFVSLA